jgi:hypothetical protein
VVSCLAGGLGPASLAVVTVAAIVWQVLLFRAGVKVDATNVVLRSPFGTQVLPRPTVRRFRVGTRRAPLDVLNQAVILIVEMTDGTERDCRWVAWQDIASAFTRTDATRPLTRSQVRVTDRLNRALDTPAASATPDQ